METEIDLDLDLEKENIRKLLKAGNSFKNIAENYNISTTKLWTFVRKNNLKENFKPFKECPREKPVQEPLTGECVMKYCKESQRKS